MVGGCSVVVKPRGGIRVLVKLGSIVDVYVSCSKYEDIGIEVDTGIKFAMDGGLEQVSSAISNLLDVASIGGNQQHRGREAPLPLSVSMDPS
jgi:hypothetical protein